MAMFERLYFLYENFLFSLKNATPQPIPAVIGSGIDPNSVILSVIDGLVDPTFILESTAFKSILNFSESFFCFRFFEFLFKNWFFDWCCFLKKSSYYLGLVFFHFLFQTLTIKTRNPRSEPSAIQFLDRVIEFFKRVEISTPVNFILCVYVNHI